MNLRGVERMMHYEILINFAGFLAPFEHRSTSGSNAAVVAAAIPINDMWNDRQWELGSCSELSGSCSQGVLLNRAQ